MFQGGTALTLDAKGRLAIPARHREALAAASGGQLVLTAHPHGCLLLYPKSAWEPIRQKILETSSFDPRTAPLKRLMIGNALEMELDSAGRLLVAPELRQHAKLDKAVRFNGMGSHFELWSEEGWQRQNEAAQVAASGDQPPPGFEDIAL
jgi:MraZ protein